jgi:DNA adenine methylase
MGSAAMPRATPRPFVKWAGGKRALLEQIREHVPSFTGRYFEPFVGGAALFFELVPAKATLADTNHRLVRAYRGLRDDPDRVIELLRQYRHNRRFFERMRRLPVDDRDDAELCAWLVYLNKTGYNGLYRVNSKNRFNVPFGNYKNPNICDEPNLRACSRALRDVDLAIADFEQVASRAEAGDLVYFDPPYVPLSSTSSFVRYTMNGFDMTAQTRLRDLARSLKERGVHVLVSNSNAPQVRTLYAEGFEHVPIRARRSINCRPDGRGEILELLIK